MQEHVLPRSWIERRSIERRCNADNPVCILGSARCAYGQPTAIALAPRGIWLAMSLRILSKPNRSYNTRSRQTSPTK